MRSILLLVSVLALFSCQKVITVDLNSVDPQKVLEANLKEGADSLLIQLSETGDYFNFSSSPKVENAIVELLTEDGRRLIAQMTSPGEYWIDSIGAVAGEKYTLEVTADGKFSSAVSHLPLAVPIDSLYFKYIEPNGFFEGGIIPFISFKDPADETNYYRLVVYINGFEVNNLDILDDKFINGTQVELDLSNDDFYVPGDSIYAELRSIDAEVYKYYNTLIAISGGGGPPGIAPGNPTTNLKGDIQLGYFGTYSSSIAKGEFPE